MQTGTPPSQTTPVAPEPHQDTPATENPSLVLEQEAATAWRAIRKDDEKRFMEMADPELAESEDPSAGATAPPDGEDEPEPEPAKAPDEPPVTAPAAEPDDDDLKAFPSERPSRDDWKRMREVFKERKAQLAEARAKLAEAEAQRPAVPPAPVTAPVQAPASAPADAVSPALVFQALALAEGGELTEAQHPELVLQEVDQHIRERITPEQALQVYNAAKSGQFGARSPEIADLVLKHLPVIQAATQLRQRQAAAASEAETARTLSWGQVFKQMPELSQKDGPERKAFEEFSKSVVDEFPDMVKVPTYPVTLLKLYRQHKAAATAEEVTKRVATLETENAELKKRLGSVQSGQTGQRPPHRQETSRLTPEQELAADLKKLGHPAYV